MNTPETMYDIAVTGGGLAGLSLAIQCAEAGYNTVLFEKEEYPFHKVCGEYISNESKPFLQRLGIDLEAFQLPHIHQLHLSDSKGNSYSFPLEPGGFGISRYTLDNALYKLALAKGVSVFTNTKVNAITYTSDGFNIITSNQNIKAKIACGSYGKRSNLDLQWKRPFAQQKKGRLTNYIGIKYHIKYPQPANTIALHNFSNGYCGISNIEDGKCCLCYLTTADNLRKHGNSIAKMETDLLARNPFLKQIWQTADFLYHQPLAISQVSFAPKSQVENQVLILGDAAGLITPLCGNGMSMAMHSSLIAFRNIDLFLQGKIQRAALETCYKQQWQHQFKNRLFAGRMIQRLFGGNTSTRLFLQMMKQFPSLAKAVIDATHGAPF